MKRREFLQGMGITTLALPLRKRRNIFGVALRETPEELYDRSITIDVMAFAGVAPRGYVTYFTEDKIEALRTSGITLLSICVTSGESRLREVDSIYLEVQQMIGEWDAFISRNSAVFKKVQNHAQLLEVKRSGKVGLSYNFQMAAPFGWDLNKLDRFIELGVRQIQLVGGRRNYLVDSCWEPSNAGLSKFGYTVIEAFNEKGVIVDLAHVGDRSAYDAILASRQPVINSHSGCLALCPHPRNASDRNIKAMAERGGVFCIYNQSGWLTKDPVISMDHYVAHIEHVINIAGEDHVAMGTDQDAVDMTAMRPGEAQRHNAGFKRRRKDYPELDWEVKHMRVPELSHPKRLLHLTQALHKKGYKSRTIEKIIGLNYVRVFKQVVG